MKQRKLKGYVLPTLYVLILVLVFGAVSLVTTLMNTNPNYLYSIDVMGGSSMPVVNTDGAISGIIRPYTSESVSISKYFYDTESDVTTQENALIYFENTYMKNTGVLYTASEAFDCISVLDGTILNIQEDELLGNVVEVEHNTNLRTIYYSLDEVEVNVGDVVNQGDVIGTSGSNQVNTDDYNLLFEVYYNGTLINPEEFYDMDVSTLN